MVDDLVDGRGNGFQQGVEDVAELGRAAGFGESSAVGIQVRCGERLGQGVVGTEPVGVTASPAAQVVAGG
ncbi:hypothetical protein [Streptomyces acidiscabies]|uniref:Uncharacterized protein n=1 Tax=Streptomyces acidiscabies TaxID=42234 RepID=A0AAP6BJB7_9ACTN|nr:hypothetical protein [Streptomyces acidiscabies]MBZ3916728.1 hypothetical protein [Streptomyces acidiscabies]MDX2965635.1 hypothetical protein [Streptomyces acidiscabies]MDX3024863.1 hypothetical protein [Streptomyces acidiscabies]MDX3795551.1 hypothetical protein [Streptomyces acidiscabies]